MSTAPANAVPIDIAGLRFEAQRDAEVAALGARIARPGRPLRWLVSAARRRERHDLHGVIAGPGPNRSAATTGTVDHMYNHVIHITYCVP